MGLGDLIYENQPVDRETVEVAEEVFPDLWGSGTDKATQYRLLLLKEYLRRDGRPLKRNKNGAYRTENQSRWDRALGKVSEKVERHESAVRKCALRMYDEDGGTAQFREDMTEIERRLD